MASINNVYIFLINEHPDIQPTVRFLLLAVEVEMEGGSSSEHFFVAKTSGIVYELNNPQR